MFDLATRDSYFTILVEVFTNHILAENRYFMNYIESTENKTIVLKPQTSTKLLDNLIILTTFLSMISTINHFFIKRKFCKHYFLQSS